MWLSWNCALVQLPYIPMNANPVSFVLCLWEHITNTSSSLIDKLCSIYILWVELAFKKRLLSRVLALSVKCFYEA